MNVHDKLELTEEDVIGRITENLVLTEKDIIRWIDPELICKICQQDFKDQKELLSHLRKHNITKVEYYDRFYKTDSVGLCLNCGKPTKFERDGFGYRRFCSSRCSNSSSITKKILSENLMKKYGVTNVFKLDTVKVQIVTTAQFKYGVSHHMKSTEFRDELKKVFIENMGVDNPFKNSEVINKIKQTNMIKYGVEWNQSNKEIRSKGTRTNQIRYGGNSCQCDPNIRIKTKSTCLIKYGFMYALQSDVVKMKIKNTCLRKYGVESTNQVLHIHKKKMKSMFRKKSFILPSGKEILIMGEEDSFLKFVFQNQLLSEEIFDFDQKIVIDYTFNNKQHKYFPDFYIPIMNLIIEIKSSWVLGLQGIDINKEKKNFTQQMGYEYIIIIDKNYTEFQNLIKGKLCQKN